MVLGALLLMVHELLRDVLALVLGHYDLPVRSLLARAQAPGNQPSLPKRSKYRIL